MTVEQKAEEYVKNTLCEFCVTNEIFKDCKKTCKAKKIYKDGYLVGQFNEQMKTKCIVHTDNSKVIEQLEKENEKLKAQIEKMKCCSSCKQYKSFLQNECTYDYLHSEECKKNHFSKWELAKGN